VTGPDGVTGPVILDGLDEVRAAVGRDLGVTDWVLIDQERVDLFAEATGDRRWIHVDVERARETSIGGTVAHRWLVLALTNLLLPQLVEVRGISAGVNYGTEEARFPAPVPVGARVRGRATVTGAAEVRGGVQTTIRITVEIEGSDEPACVVDSLSRWLA